MKCVDDVARDEERMIEDAAVEGDRRLDALDEELVESPARAREALLAVAPPDDELAEQAVVERRHHVALVHVGVESHPGAAGQDPAGHPFRATGMKSASGSSALMRNSMA